MKDRKKLKLKKFYFHPITMFLVLTLFIVLLSGLLSLLEVQATYNIVNVNTKELEPTLITVENMLSFDGIKFIISNAAKNFLSFGPLGMLLLSLIGITVAEGTGFIETFTRRHLSKIPKTTMTFLVIFVAICSSLINEVGYAILIPLMALIYFINNRNPILGIVTAFCGVAFGYGVSIFVGSMEVSLMSYTRDAAILIDETTHIALTSNLIFIMVVTIILSIVGTIVIEKVVAPKIGKYKKDEEFAKTETYKVINIEEEEQRMIEKDKYEKKGLRSALIVSIIVLIVFIYSLIPNLPFSGMLLDMNEQTYVNQLFGENSYFQDGFTYLVSLVFILAGIAYGFGSKTVKNDKEIIENASKKFSNLGSMFILIFVVAQFIAIFRKSNIGMIVAAWLASLLEHMTLSGIPLVLISLILIALANFLLTSPASKWMIFSPIMVPMFMQSNISPQFAQIVLRAGDSMTKGFTPLLASFVIYIGYLNIYNLHKDKPYTIKRSLGMITPYFIVISITWILIVIGWYIIGLPIGPGVSPTI
ncbi:MAG: AbgT family transporter [Bacilli bacterium]|nr:AbgT family transporter [Bacilli bacterium]